jgi:hypothetical protein
MGYDIFISYRRKGSGAGVAGELQSKLQNRGYKVFLDVDNIGSGAFPDQIDRAIQQCKDFLLILSPGMLDRCVEEEDWVRHEIVLAEKYGKNIVGVSLPGFVMPSVESLPAELHDIPEKQVFLWSHEYRQASFEKIVLNLLTTSMKKKRAKRNYLWIGLVVVLLVGGLWWLKTSLAEPPTVEETPPVVVPSKEEVLIDYRQLFAEAVTDTFNSYLATADSLLQLVPENPTDQQDFVLFMEGIGKYNEAMAYESNYPGVISNLSSVTTKLESLMLLRQNRFKEELEAATKFLKADLIDFARYRYENAQILALPDEAGELEAVGKKFPKVK